jgi:hypothetical protein
VLTDRIHGVIRAVRESLWGRLYLARGVCQQGCVAPARLFAW